MSSPTDQPASTAPDRPCVGCAELGYDAARCEDYHRFASRATPGVPVPAPAPAPAVKMEEDSDADGIFTDEMKDWLDYRPRGRRQLRRGPRRQHVGPRGPVSAVSRGAPANHPRGTAVPRAVTSVTLARRPAVSGPADRSESVAPVSSSSAVLDIASTLAFLKDESLRLGERMATMEQKFEMRISALERQIAALKKALE